MREARLDTNAFGQPSTTAWSLGSGSIRTPPMRRPAAQRREDHVADADRQRRGSSRARHAERRGRHVDRQQRRKVSDAEATDPRSGRERARDVAAAERLADDCGNPAGWHGRARTDQHHWKPRSARPSTKPWRNSR
ncbi:MAG: hypothetical protein U1F17_04975 [Burkholderiaceae bacterium]